MLLQLLTTPRYILRLTYAVVFGSDKGGNVPERDDLYASGLNLMRNGGGDY